MAADYPRCILKRQVTPRENGQPKQESTIRRRLGWLSHVTRTSDNRMPKQANPSSMANARALHDTRETMANIKKYPVHLKMTKEDGNQLGRRISSSQGQAATASRGSVHH